MPYFRIRASDGKCESVFEEKFDDEARLGEQLAKRGWTILSVEQIAEPAPNAPVQPAPPPPIRADQIREEANWVYLPPEIAEKHPLHGIGGWTGLLLAQMVIGGFVGVWALFRLAPLLGLGALILLLFLIVLVVQVTNLICIVMLLKRSTAFPTLFVVLASISIAAGLFLIVLGDFSAGNIGAIIGNVLWLSYVLMSRRVNVTFRGRVEREDEWLKQGLAAAGAPALAPAR